jgi:hypothetical protein
MKTELREFSGVDTQYREVKVKADARDREIAQLRESLEHIKRYSKQTVSLPRTNWRDNARPKRTCLKFQVSEVNSQ